MTDKERELIGVNKQLHCTIEDKEMRIAWLLNALEDERQLTEKLQRQLIEAKLGTLGNPYGYKK